MDTSPRHTVQVDNHSCSNSMAVAPPQQPMANSMADAYTGSRQQQYYHNPPLLPPRAMQPPLAGPVGMSTDTVPAGSALGNLPGNKNSALEPHNGTGGTTHAERTLGATPQLLSLGSFTQMVSDVIHEAREGGLLSSAGGGGRRMFGGGGGGWNHGNGGYPQPHAAGHQDVDLEDMERDIVDVWAPAARLPGLGGNDGGKQDHAGGAGGNDEGGGSLPEFPSLGALPSLSSLEALASLGISSHSLEVLLQQLQSGGLGELDLKESGPFGRLHVPQVNDKQQDLQGAPDMPDSHGMQHIKQSGTPTYHHHQQVGNEIGSSYLGHNNLGKTLKHYQQQQQSSQQQGADVARFEKSLPDEEDGTLFPLCRRAVADGPKMIGPSAFSPTGNGYGHDPQLTDPLSTFRLAVADATAMGEEAGMYPAEAARFGSSSQPGTPRLNIQVQLQNSKRQQQQQQLEGGAVAAAIDIKGTATPAAPGKELLELALLGHLSEQELIELLLQQQERRQQQQQYQQQHQDQQPHYPPRLAASLLQHGDKSALPGLPRVPRQAPVYPHITPFRPAIPPEAPVDSFSPFHEPRPHSQVVRGHTNGGSISDAVSAAINAVAVAAGGDSAAYADYIQQVLHMNVSSTFNQG